MSIDPKSSYYDMGGIETIDIIKAKLTPEQYEGYLLGNAMKYQCRVNFKTPYTRTRDAKKAEIYSRLFSQLIKDNQNDNPETTQTIIEL